MPSLAKRYLVVLPALLAAVLGGSLTASAGAARLTPGNLIVTTPFESTVFEYTRAGTQVQALPVPYPATPRPRTEYVRDIVATGTREVLAYNGTFAPFLSIHDTGTGGWVHSTHPAWETENNTTYGGIAARDRYVYVTDMHNSDTRLGGIVRFDRSNSTSAAFPYREQFSDLTVGQDGLLYALHTSEWNVSVIDPETMARLRVISLDALGIRAIAVDAAGHIFAASEDNLVYHFDAAGVTLDSAPTGIEPPGDIDLAPNGDIALGADDGHVILTNKAFSDMRLFPVGNREPEPASAFVAFVEADVNRPPDCSRVTVTPAVLSPAKRHFTRVRLAGATDPDGDAVGISITAVSQDEPVSGRGAGKLAPDARTAAAPDRVRLRRERNGQGDGRVYRISFTVSDGNGGSCDGTATVGVPRKKRVAAVDSSPPAYDSFGV
jgi:hypothetical protein